MTRAADVVVAHELHADYVGVIFAGGPRLLTAERAADVLGARGEGGPQRVGVFGAQMPREIADTARAAMLDVVQLHSDPDEAAVAEVRTMFGGNVWAVLRVEGTALPAARLASLLRVADAVVLDAKVAGQLGGTGVALAWTELRAAVDLARRAAGTTGRLVLAGGLTPENVAAAVAALAPDVVDVSSGVERAPGSKDHDRMRAFARAARAPRALDTQGAT